ncbi:adenylyltransferase/cytidyltransferase family protein [Patescibacteria group bacterium]
MKKVLVTGVFDILHQEHINFLKAAKKEGDTLIIGLESDARTKQLKGQDRPVNPLATRIQNLKQLGIADKVFALPERFNTFQDHQALIKQINPDILAVSSHTPNLEVKRQIIKSLDGELKIVHQHNPDISTTKMIK